MNVENFHGKAARLWDAILDPRQNRSVWLMLQTYIKSRITRFAAVSADDRILGAVIKHALFQVFGQVVMNNEFSSDDTLGASVGALVWSIAAFLDLDRGAS